MVPPGEDAAFVAAMEDILDIYHRPFDPLNPAICMDGQPVRLIGEKRVPVGAEPGRPFRFGYEYIRNGTAEIFMFTEPPGGRRCVNVRDNKKGTGWADGMRQLLEEDYPDAGKITLICDNCSTHTVGSFYKKFPPEQARNLIKRLDIHCTPKHGSRPNTAEMSALTHQCLDRRIPDTELLRSETEAWELKRNAGCKTDDWQFKTEDARIKLKRLYPQF